MSNAAGAKATREEEIAFLAIERVLGVDIKLADAGTGDRQPDGTWISTDGQERHGIVEITSPPASWLMHQLARAKKTGKRYIESGSFPTRSGELALVCSEMLATPWATENIDKLLSQAADERHLFLFGRRHEDQAYFRRLSEPDAGDHIDHLEDLALSPGISSVWFRGRTTAIGGPYGDRRVRLARFETGYGWHRYEVQIHESELPAPGKRISEDQVPTHWRSPKSRAGAAIR